DSDVAVRGKLLRLAPHMVAVLFAVQPVHRAEQWLVGEAPHSGPSLRPSSIEHGTYRVDVGCIDRRRSGGGRGGFGVGEVVGSHHPIMPSSCDSRGRTVNRRASPDMRGRGSPTT